jgi:hypothetical protein
VLLTLPGFAFYDAMIMTEIPQGALILGAAMALARYVDHAKSHDAVQFALWSAASFLAKGTGLVLAPLPILTVALTGRWSLLARLPFWLPMPIVLAIAGPWYLLAPGARHERAVPMGGPGLMTSRLEIPPWVWQFEIGWPVAILALIGVGWLVVRGRRLAGIEAVSIALVVSATTFPFLFAVWELRHQVESSAAFVIVAFATIQAFPRTRLRNLLVALVTALLMAWSFTHLRPQRELGYARLAGMIAKGKAGPAKAMLISADAVGEGALIVQIAHRETRPGRYVLRSSKLLADLNWLGRDARERFATQAEMQAFLSSLPLDLVILDRWQPARFPYHALLETTLVAGPREWVPWQAPGLSPRFRVFARSGAVPLSGPELHRRLEKLASAPRF